MPSKGQRARSTRILPPEWKTPGIVEEFCQWIEERGAQPDTTLKTYRGTLNRLAYWLYVHRGETTLEQATTYDLRAWRSSLTVSRVSVQHYVETVQGFYKWAARSGRIPRDPAWEIPKPRKRRRAPRPIDEGSLLIAVTTAPDRIRPWLILAAWSGLRAAEIAGLERQDIYESGDRPYMIVLGKGDKERNVPLHPYVWEALLIHGLPPSGPIFLREDGRPVNSAIVSEQANTYLHGLGIDATLHQLRHRFASITLDHGGEIRELQDVLGHASLDQTAGYTRARSQVAHAMVAAIPRGPNSRESLMP